MREGLNNTRYLGFVCSAHHILTMNIFHRAICGKTKADNTMHKQLIICFLMGSVKSDKEGVKYTE